MNATVAICTWNRARLLDKTLEQFRNLRVPAGVEWELLVVNNNCTDDTDAVVAKHAGVLPLRGILERKQGLSNARNCAIGHARGDLLIWTDDDVLVDPEWLAEYLKAAEAFPDAGYFGGTVDPWFERTPPAWMTRHLRRLEGVFAIRQLGPEVRPLVGDEDVFGASMAFRTELLREGGFDPNLGRSGKAMLCAEEVALTARLRKAGRFGVWVGTARVRHFIPKERISARYVRKFFHGLGQTIVRRGTEGDSRGTRLWGVPRWWYRAYLRERLTANWRWLTGREWLEPFIMASIRGGMIAEFRATRNGPETNG